MLGGLYSPESEAPQSGIGVAAGDKPPAARASRSSSLPTSAMPFPGDVQPVYPASSELEPLHPAALTSGGTLAAIAAGLKADGTQWEAQFEAILLLRRVVVHHPAMLLVAHASPGAVCGTAAAAGPSRGRSAGAVATTALTAAAPARRGGGQLLLQAPSSSPVGGAGPTALAALLPLLLCCADSLRSSVSRHALMALADVWRSDPAPLAAVRDGELDGALTLLLRRACDTSAFLSDAAADALWAVTAHACEGRLLGCLLAAGAHRNSTLRCAAAPWMDRAVAHAVAARAARAACSSSTAGGTTTPLGGAPPLGRDVAERLLQAACAQLAEGSPAARHAGHRLARRLWAAGWADGRALSRLQDRDATRLREVLLREPPPDVDSR